MSASVGGIALPGNATAAQVESGYTFSSGSGVGLSGTYSPATSFPLPAISAGTLYSITIGSASVSAPTNSPLVLVGVSYLGYWISSITDTFATHYTWTQVVTDTSKFGSIWVGSGGSGGTGQVVLTMAAGTGVQLLSVVPFMHTTTLTTVASVSSNPATSTATLSATPTAANQCVVGYYASNGAGSEILHTPGYYNAQFNDQTAQAGTTDPSSVGISNMTTINTNVVNMEVNYASGFVDGMGMAIFAMS